MGRTFAKCRTCPFYKSGWCSHLAKRVNGDAVGCRFGAREKHNAYMRAYMNKRRRNCDE